MRRISRKYNTFSCIYRKNLSIYNNIRRSFQYLY